ncbi:MAG: hypothetical protein JXL84_22440 [Deltaproteobacteria bacterium]|nr:hypothetical protein [Deltaproteobacteria bacterium]
MKTMLSAFALFLCFLAVPVFAQEPIDGKNPLICATLEAIRCERGEPCEKGLPENMGAPQFMRIDFGKKEIIGAAITTPIRLMEMDNLQITLQGYELGMGWTMAIDRATGKTSITLTGREETFVIFGTCIPFP